MLPSSMPACDVAFVAQCGAFALLQDFRNRCTQALHIWCMHFGSNCQQHVSLMHADVALALELLLHCMLIMRIVCISCGLATAQLSWPWIT